MKRIIKKKMTPSDFEDFMQIIYVILFGLLAATAFTGIGLTLRQLIHG